MFWKGSRVTGCLKVNTSANSGYWWIKIVHACTQCCWRIKIVDHCCFLFSTAIARLRPCRRTVCSQLCNIAWSPRTSFSFARFADSHPGCVLLARVGVGRPSNCQHPFAKDFKGMLPHCRCSAGNSQHQDIFTLITSHYILLALEVRGWHLVNSYW